MEKASFLDHFGNIDTVHDMILLERQNVIKRKFQVLNNSYDRFPSYNSHRFGYDNFCKWAPQMSEC